MGSAMVLQPNALESYSTKSAVPIFRENVCSIEFGHLMFDCKWKSCDDKHITSILKKSTNEKTLPIRILI